MLYELRLRRGLIELVCDERVVLAMTPEQARRNAVKLATLADEAEGKQEVQSCQQPSQFPQQFR